MVKTAGMACIVSGAWTGAASGADIDPANWDAVKKAAKGQTVFFHAWAGSSNINDYLVWAGKEIKTRYGVTLKHVKVNGATSKVVATILAEKTAGKTDKGSVDLVWVNGENFAAMKTNGLLLAKPWATKLPAYKYVDEKGKPSVLYDFTVPTDGLEAPWGMAKLVFYGDSATVKNFPRSMNALKDWAMKNPGRFTYPKPGDFTGTTFLKQALIELAADPALLAKPVDQVDFDAVTKPLWAYLDALHPSLWRKGKTFPSDYAKMKNLLADGETDIAFAFNPNEASSGIAKNELPATVRSFVLDKGTIGNSHFVAIPFNANAKAGAMIVANFLMSAKAQARKEDVAIWGDPTVLNVAALPAADKARFAALKRGVATLKPEELGALQPEPHPSWVDRLVAAWTKRYGVQ